MHAFDPSQPHGQVCGGAVRLWEQNGVIFDVNHLPVELLADGTVKALKTTDQPVTEDDLIGDGNYAKKTTEQLKQLCTVYGIDFKSRDQAVKALEGQ